MNKKSKSILIIMIIAVICGILIYNIFLKNNDPEIFSYKFYGSDATWKAETEITNLHVSGEQKYFDIKFEYLDYELNYNEGNLLQFVLATSQTMEILTYHKKDGYINYDSNSEKVRVTKLDDNIYIVSFKFPIEITKNNKVDNYRLVVSISGEKSSQFNLYKKDK